MTIASDDLAVQAALVAALSASADLAALIGTRLYDEVPDATLFDVSLPCVVLGESRARNLAAATDCMPSAEIDSDILVYSRPSNGGAARGFAEAKAIVAAIRAAAGDDVVLVAAGWTFRLQRWLTTSYQREDGGRTFAAVVTIRTRIQPAEV